MIGNQPNSGNQNSSGMAQARGVDQAGAPGANSSTSSATPPSAITPPSISLPKGGGAIRGMGEKFAANPVSGTGSMSVPIATSPGRSGFGPQLSLSYDSGAGNGPFGFGWNLSLPSITRKTDKGLPQYNDTEESDVYILSGAEDLVPVLQPDGGRFKDVTTSPGYVIHRYRPRIEGFFARIERWTKVSTGEIHWRSISRDNVTTLYGKSNNSRIFDPAEITDTDHPEPTHPKRIFSWLICESYDDKGNAIVYEYKEEDSQRIFEDQQGNFVARAHEQNRDEKTRSANRYIKRIKYGNKKPNRDQDTWEATDPGQLPQDTWMFEVVFDYEDGHYPAETKEADGRIFARPVHSPPAIAKWKARLDPFSVYRAGFEVRTYRLCQRVLMFHHFPDEEGVGADCLVRSTDFTYSYEQEPSSAHNPVYTFLREIVQSGYKRDNGRYLKRSLPPLEFKYSQPSVHDTVEEVDPESLENLPVGLDGTTYQWTDLHGEGIPGILTEQGGAWFYKPNLSPINVKSENGTSHVEAKFAPVEVVAVKPNLVLAGGQVQFMDFAGDGQPDLVMLDGPTPGLYEHDQAEGWEPFRPFTARLNRDTRDPNLKFVDLDGDGHADVLITEDDAFVWHPSLAEQGFGGARRVAQALDEEKGPRLVFADGTQSIYLADLSGDGLTDIVRIRSGEVCYWPNLGYGKFGAKVAMDHAPHFDHPDLFDHQRIRLADIDGTGTTDIIYLHGDGVRLYFNQSGNSWSEPQQLNVFPRVDDLVSIVPTHLLGNGTACLVWSSPLPGDARRPMRYVNLMGGQKPHLLIKTVNNLGAETVVQYAPSTKFYLQDKRDGKPWITRLPFPVHVVEKVTVTDKWRKTTFSSSYSYHHGYFDGIEREFRGFGRVEQLDSESYGEFASGNVASPYIADDKTLYQPPVKTVTWYHTGAALDREHILLQFEPEYFPHWFEAVKPDEENVLGEFRENVLPEPDLDAEDLNTEEWREAMRACKGLLLRQEVYELEVDALERGEQRPVKLFSTAYHNCHIRRLQPKANNPHAVFLVAESEAMTYHYELDLTPTTVRPDPRVVHTLNLQIDEYANVLQSVAVVYPRLGQFEDNTLQPDALALIRRVQQETHLAYTETRYTNDIEEADSHRLRVPCEVLTYELTGIGPEDAGDRDSADPRDNRYFALDELRRFQLSTVYQPDPKKELIPVPEIPYHHLAQGTTPEKRPVEQVRMLYFKDDAPRLTDPLPFGKLGALRLPYETYTLALTGDILSAVFDAKLTADARTKLNDAAISGYLNGAALAARFPGTDTTGQHWIPSGIAGFAPDAAQHFYLPERYTDPFGNVTALEYDPRDLFVASSTDALNNTTRVTQFDYRVLAPREMQDINGNLSEVFFDLLGLPAAMALKDKGTEGDNLIDLTDAQANPTNAELKTFFDAPDLDEVQARRWLGNATARHVYYFGEVMEEGKAIWATHPACACGILREQHVKPAPAPPSPLQAAFEYSDGMGSVVVKQVQAEPEAIGQPLRWVASGKTILNNKGKPVKQYEPYFCLPDVGHRFEEPREEGVTPVMYYDAVGRMVRTEMPDGSFSLVEFSPWHVTSYDQNDTAFDPDPLKRSEWYKRRMDAAHPRLAEFNSAENARAAKLVETHAGTPSLTLLDSLGRDVVSIAHNRVKDAAVGLKDEKYLTFTKLDAEGKPLWIRDARNNLVMQYITPPVPNNQPADPVSGFVPCYDIAGNLLFQHSMDAGDRWTLNDAVGKPMHTWDSRGHTFRHEYDALRRPVRAFVKGADPDDPQKEILYERVIYSEQYPNAATLNLCGRPFMQFDSAGVVTFCATNPAGDVEAYDFKGNLLRSTRRLAQDYKGLVDWSSADATIPSDGKTALDLARLETALSASLETETFASATRYDALNRPIQLVAPHSDRNGQPIPVAFNVIRPGYNEAGLLERVDVWLEQAREEAELLDPKTASPHGVEKIDYNAKGQRLKMVYKNDVTTTHKYDEETFRLSELQTERSGDFPAGRRTVQDLCYEYDPVGNITSIRDQAQHRVFHDNDCIDASTEYQYDPLYRLIAAKGREHKGQDLQVDWDDGLRSNNLIPNDCQALQNYVEEYQYDAVGNILQMAHHRGSSLDQPGLVIWNRRYQYSRDSNRLLATSQPSDQDNLPDHTTTPGYSAKYGYDDHGNMTRMFHLQLMQWDYRDQLQATAQQVQNNGIPETTYYVYDAGGQRVRKITECAVTAAEMADGKKPARMKEWIYQGVFEIYRKNGGNPLERETLHIMDDKQRIALVETRTLDTAGNDPAPRQLIRYQFGNHLGSASLELDDQAEVISYEEYYPYGSMSYQAVRNQTETPNRYRYTGKERDEESGLYYYGARYYAAWLSKWISSDRKVTLSQSFCSYQFCSSNPITRKDVDGNRDDWNMDPQALSWAVRPPGSQPARSKGPCWLDRQVSAFGDKWQHGSTSDRVELVATATGTASGVVPYVGDYVSLASSLVALGAKPSWSNLGNLALDVPGALLPIVPALGTLRRAEKLAEIGHEASSTKKISTDVKLVAPKGTSQNPFAKVSTNEIGDIVETNMKRATSESNVARSRASKTDLRGQNRPPAEWEVDAVVTDPLPVYRYGSDLVHAQANSWMTPGKLSKGSLSWGGELMMRNSSALLKNWNDMRFVQTGIIPSGARIKIGIAGPQGLYGGGGWQLKLEPGFEMKKGLYYKTDYDPD